MVPGCRAAPPSRVGTAPEVHGVRAVEASHPGVTLRPYADVLELCIDMMASHEHFMRVCPVHELEVNGPVLRDRGHVGEHALEEGHELVPVHLTGRHFKVPVLCLSTSADLVYLDV